MPGPTVSLCAASSIYGRFLTWISCRTARKTALRPGVTAVKASVRAVDRFRNPLTAPRRRGQLCNPDHPIAPLWDDQTSDCYKYGAAGNRNRETGALGGAGTNGEYWGSSSNAAGNINASSVYFIASTVNPFGNPNRANGYSVRCVQHLYELIHAVEPARFTRR